MKIGTRKKSVFLAVLLALLSAVLCFAACAFDGTVKLTNASGFIVQGGFEEGCVLEARAMDSESEDYALTIAAIEAQSYDKTKPVYAFDVCVLKDGVKVQPNGKVKVTIPVDADLTGYAVLHVKDDGEIEQLSFTYKNGKAVFETDAFSKFVFVKKIEESAGDGGADGGNGGVEDGGNTVKYSFYAIARSIVDDRNNGGTVHDTDGEDVSFVPLRIAGGTQYTVRAFCYPDYYFVGWYEASELEEATQETFISSEQTYTFTIEKDLTICAVYAYKTNLVQLRLNASAAGFSCRNDEPIKTLVVKDGTDAPNYELVYVSCVQADGSIAEYSTPSLGLQNFVDNIAVDDGGLDFSKVGEYTITYAYKMNANVKATLEVQVVESGRELSVSTQGDTLKFYCNGGSELTSCDRVVAKGRPVTLTANVKDGYAFTGWYDENENLVSSKLVYCFEMPDKDVRLHGKYEASAVSLTFTIGYRECVLIDDFGNACPWSGTETKYVKTGDTVRLTVRENSAYDFKGWYDVANAEEVLLTEERTICLVMNESRKIAARFNEKIEYVEVDESDLKNGGYTDGKLVVSVGDTVADYRAFDLKAKGLGGSYKTLSADEYTIEDSEVDFSREGEYTVTFVYKYDTAIRTQIRIVVVDPKNARIEFECGYSYLDHAYNGKTTFISLKDVKINGELLYSIKATSKIWEKIDYRWIDKDTNKEVDTTDCDVTINGRVVEDFGPTDAKMTIGNEFGGPIRAGAYRFEFIYEKKVVFTQDSTISTLAYKKIRTKNEFKTNEGSTWVNFKLYYYTIVGEANGKYFVMQMPKIGYGEHEAEAREVQFDGNGNAVIGEGNDFAFVNARYYANDSSEYTEFLTGYYGSYVVRSSSNTTDGTLFGSPYIYRTGYTCVSGGKIYREYGNKEYYGMKVEFDNNGAATVYSRYYGETANNRLRLVKDGDKYVFTGVAADSDERESYDVFIYQSVMTSGAQENYEK